jgi:flagellar hook-length control protein FliK
MSPSATPDLNVTGVTPAPANTASPPVSSPGRAPALFPGDQAAGSPVRTQAFPAVLLALKAPGTRPATTLLPQTGSSLPATPTAASGPAEPPAVVLSLPPPVIGTAAREAANRLPEDAADGATLPADGTGLPSGAELELLLSSLGRPSAPVAANDPLKPVVSTTNDNAAAARSPTIEISLNADARSGGLKHAPPPTMPAPEAWELLAALTGDADQTAAPTARADAAPPSSVTRPADIFLPGFDLALPPARPDAGHLSLMRPMVSFDGSAIATPLIITPPLPAAGGAQTAASLPMDALPVLEPMADADVWSRSLGERLLMMSENGLQSARLKLHPEHLGPLEIRVSVDDDGATRVSFSAHHAQTRDALENAIPRLRELFADQGLNLAHANVDSGRGAFAQHDLPSAAPGWNDWSGDDGQPTAAQNVTTWRLNRGSQRRVDIFV